MKRLARMDLTLVHDRGQLKWMVNLIRGNRINGFLRPVNHGRF